MSYIIAPKVMLAGNVYVQRVWAEQGYLSYLEGGFAAGPRVSFTSPIESLELDWTAALTAGAVFREYDDPDVVINATEAESDWEAFVGGGLTVPLKRDVALITELEYRYVDSNYDTRKFDNFSVSLSVAKSF